MDERTLIFPELILLLCSWTPITNVYLFEKIAGMVMCNVVKMRHITAVLQNTDKDCRGTAAITLLALSEDPRQLLLAC